MKEESAAAGRHAFRAGLAFSFLLPFAAHFLYILNHFARGAFYSDSGYIASILWRNSWMLRGRFLEESFWSSHISPVFLAANGLSRILPLGKIEFYALYTGLAFGLLSAAAYLALSRIFEVRGKTLATAGVSFAAVLFSFNQVAMVVKAFPHYEVLGFSAAALFFLFYFQGRSWISWLFLALALSVRQDLGFHIAGVLIIVALTDRLQAGERLPSRGGRSLYALIAFCLAYGVIMTVVQRLGVGLLGLEHNEAFRRIYAGSPPYAHLDAGLLVDRVAFWLRTYHGLWGPFLILAIWALAERNAYLLAGYAAFAPWALLTITARHDMAGRMEMHYGTPFVISLFWPLIGLLLWRDRGGGTIRPVRHGALLLAIFAWSAAAGFAAREHRGFLPAEKTWNSGALYAFMERLEASWDRLGETYVDPSVVSLDSYPYFLERSDYGKDLRTMVYEQRFPDTVILFSTGIYTELLNGDPLFDLMLRAGPYRVHRVPRTNIVVVSRAAENTVTSLAAAPPGKSLWFDLLRSAGDDTAPGKVVGPGGRGVAAAQLPDLPAGDYEAVVGLQPLTAGGCSGQEHLLTFRLSAGGAVLGERPVPCGVLRGDARVDLSFRFTVPSPFGRGFELAVSGGDEPFLLRDFDLVFGRRSPAPPGVVVPVGTFFVDTCREPERGILLERGQPSVLVFEGMTRREKLARLTLSPGHTWQVKLFRGEKPMARISAGPLEEPGCGGLAPLDLRFPPEALASGFDSVEVTPVDGDGPFRTGGISLLEER